MTLQKIMIYCYAIGSFFIVSCASSDDNTVPLQDDDDMMEDTNPLPNKTSTYTADVKAIMDAECIRCHANPPVNGAPMPLVTFQDVVSAANDRDLTGRVSTTIERVVMPSDTGRMPQATIDIILDWSADGLLEN